MPADHYVIDRKNFPFSGSPWGAATCTTLFILLETAKVNGLKH